MACKFDGGVVLGADSRTTTGSYIANRATDKLTPLFEDRVLCCRSGSAADTQAIADIVAYYLRLTAIQQGTGPSVHQAAALMRQLCYNNKDALQAGIIVAGWDNESRQGKIFSIPLGGSLHPAPYAIGGSGSTYIYGYCDANYRENMSPEEAVQFVTNGTVPRRHLSNFAFVALALAMARDGSSGGVIRLAIITEGGVQRRVVRGTEVPVFWKH